MAHAKQDETIKARARAAGIMLMPQGEPLFARDMTEYRSIRLEVQLTDTRTPAQKDEDAYYAARMPLDYPI